MNVIQFDFGEDGGAQQIICGGTNCVDNKFSKKMITNQFMNLFSGNTGLLPL